MSQGAVFQLVSNEGRMDQLLLASGVLRDNINAVKAARAAAGESDVNPSLGDIEESHVLFVNAHFKPYVAIASQYFKVAANNVSLNQTTQISVPQYGDFFTDMVVNVVINAPTTSLTGVRANASDAVLYKHCDYPGERLFQEVSFEVNSNPLDSYTSDSYVVHRQFHVPQDKLHAWKRCMGQQLPSKAVAGLQEDSDGAAPITAHTEADVYNGYQTYKVAHSALDLWVPLLFWFNKDTSLAFPSVAVPYGQRFLSFRLAAADQLYRAIINPGATTTSLTAPTLSTPTIQKFDLYVNNLFVLPEVHDIFIDRVSFTLIRVHRFQRATLNKESDNVHLQSLKWPIETMYFGFQPAVNVAANATKAAFASQGSATSSDMEDWHRFGVVTNSTQEDTVLGCPGVWNVKDEAGHVQTIEITAHSVSLFNQFPATFYNSYLPYQLGGHSVCAPKDPGLYMASFALHPGQYQPSGHFNASRAREFYLSYTSSYIGSSASARLFVQATAINFLLISEGSASLRYST